MSERCGYVLRRLNRGWRQTGSKPSSTLLWYNQSLVDAVIQWRLWCFICGLTECKIQLISSGSSCTSVASLATLRTGKDLWYFGYLHILRRRGYVLGSSFFFFSLKALHLVKKVRHQMLSRTVLLKKSNLEYLHSPYQLQKIFFFLFLQDGNGAELTYSISTYRKKQYFLFKQPYLFYKRILPTLIVSGTLYPPWLLF